jgi:hypothetical protein
MPALAASSAKVILVKVRIHELPESSFCLTYSNIGAAAMQAAA